MARINIKSALEVKNTAFGLLLAGGIQQEVADGLPVIVLITSGETGGGGKSLLMGKDQTCQKS